jgi:hypothetical protein
VERARWSPTPPGLPITCALANRPGLLITADKGIADKGHVSRELDRSLAERGTRLPHTPSTA